MSHDLFRASLVQRPRSALRRLLTVFSIALHAVVVVTIVIIQVFAIGPLPLPRRPLVFEQIHLVHIAEIPAPSLRRPSSGSTAGTVAPNAAPTVEPRGVTQETGLENMTRASGSGVVDGGEPGGAGIESIDPIETLPPPPPLVPKVPVRVHDGIVAPRKITDVTPVYPSLAQASHVKGVVILEAVIDARGNVTSVQVLRSVPLLDAAAVDAVRQWRYTPALLNGQPVPVVVTVTVNFSM